MQTDISMQNWKKFMVKDKRAALEVQGIRNGVDNVDKKNKNKNLYFISKASSWCL